MWYIYGLTDKENGFKFVGKLQADSFPYNFVPQAFLVQRAVKAHHRFEAQVFHVLPDKEIADKVEACYLTYEFVNAFDSYNIRYGDGTLINPEHPKYSAPLINPAFVKTFNGLHKHREAMFPEIIKPRKPQIYHCAPKFLAYCLSSKKNFPRKHYVKMKQRQIDMRWETVEQTLTELFAILDAPAQKAQWLVGQKK